MSRNHDLDDRPDPIELRSDRERPTRRELTDRCTGSLWCECWDCERVPADGHFAHDAQPVEDYGMGEW